MQIEKSVEKVLRRLLRAKRARRRDLAKLPMEKKLEIVSQLQRFAREISTIGKTLRKP
jgi:hypothetical protein